MKRGLLISPEFPADSFWSYKYIINYINRKTAFPPLGLLTFAAQMPPEWDFDLVDLNVSSYSNKTLAKKIDEADAVFVSAMSIQKRSLVELLKNAAQGSQTPWVLGGAMASTYRDEILNPQTESDRILFEGIDLLVWGESNPWIESIHDHLERHPHHSSSEPMLLIPARAAASRQGSGNHLMDREIFKPLTVTKPPRWDLIEAKHYQSLMIQATAGCPFRCDFCDIIQFNGGFTRAKSHEAISLELQAIFDTGHRGGVFSVDDNFIGDPLALSSILDAMIEFQHEHGYPFNFYTQASVNLGKPRLEPLIGKMKQAGFQTVFLGIENPDPGALRGMNKKQNNQVDLESTIKKIQAAGIEVQAGFIFGGDEDTPCTTGLIVDFVKKTHIFSAMAGMLTPLPHTPLYEKLRAQKRLIPNEYIGNNTDDSASFMPQRMSIDELRDGIHTILNQLFNSDEIYRRGFAVLQNVPPHIFRSGHFKLVYLKAAVLSLWNQGIKRMDANYFRYLANAWKLDRTRLDHVRMEMKSLKHMYSSMLSGKYIEYNDHLKTQFNELVAYAHDFMVRQQRDGINLQHIQAKASEWTTKLNEETLTRFDIDEIIENAQSYLAKKKKLFRFPGFHLVQAFELAVKGLHYEKVKHEITSKYVSRTQQDGF